MTTQPPTSSAEYSAASGEDGEPAPRRRPLSNRPRYVGSDGRLYVCRFPRPEPDGPGVDWYNPACRYCGRALTVVPIAQSATGFRHLPRRRGRGLPR